MSTIKTVDDLIQQLSDEAYVSTDMAEEAAAAKDKPDYIKHRAEANAYEHALEKVKELKANMEKKAHDQN